MVLAALLLASTLSAAPPAAVPHSDPAEVLAALGTAWTARDLTAYLAPWEFESPEAEAAERDWAHERLRGRPPVAIDTSVGT